MFTKKEINIISILVEEERARIAQEAREAGDGKKIFKAYSEKLSALCGKLYCMQEYDESLIF